MSGRGRGRAARAARGLVVSVALVVGAAGVAQAADLVVAGEMTLESECVLELRGGTAIRAQVLEYLPGSHVILRAFDGQTFRLPIEEVMDIRHPGDGPLPPSSACDRILPPIRAPRPSARRRAADGATFPGPSELPTAPDDEPASRHARPPAPVPATAAPAAATGPPVTLETDQPNVELQVADGVKKIETSYRGRPSIRWEYVWKKVCDAPCGLPIGEEGIYRVDGEGVRATAPFRLDGLGDGPFHLKLRLGPAGMYRAGVGSVVLGVLSSLTGVGLAIAGGVNAPTPPAYGTPASYLTDYQSAQSSQRTMFTVGGVLIGSGIIGTIAGALLMRRGKSLVTIERPRRPVDPNPEQPE